MQVGSGIGTERCIMCRFGTYIDPKVNLLLLMLQTPMNAVAHVIRSETGYISRLIRPIKWIPYCYLQYLACWFCFLNDKGVPSLTSPMSRNCLAVTIVWAQEGCGIFNNCKVSFRRAAVTENLAAPAKSPHGRRCCRDSTCGARD